MAEHHSFQDQMLPPGEPVLGKTYRADGWGYFDFPRCTPEFWAELMAVIGRDNFVALTLADYGRSIRGQLLISPGGMARLRTWAHTEQAMVQ